MKTCKDLNVDCCFICGKNYKDANWSCLITWFSKDIHIKNIYLNSFDANKCYKLIENYGNFSYWIQKSFEQHHPEYVSLFNKLSLLK